LDWLNLFALVLAAVGSLILAMSGLPKLKTVSSGAYSLIDETTPQSMRAKRLSRFGLWLLVAGFVLQAIAQVFDISFAQTEYRLRAI